MPFSEDKSTWEPVHCRVPPELALAIKQFGDDIGEDIISNVLRILIAAGLEQKGRGNVHEDRVVLDNAKATAIRRLDALVTACIEDFRDNPLTDEDDEDDDDELEDEANEEDDE